MPVAHGQMWASGLIILPLLDCTLLWLGTASQVANISFSLPASLPQDTR